MSLVLHSMLGFLILENLVELYLTFRQVLKITFIDFMFFFSDPNQLFKLRVYKTSKKVPEELKDSLKEDTFEKAR